MSTRPKTFTVTTRFHWTHRGVSSGTYPFTDKEIDFDMRLSLRSNLAPFITKSYPHLVSLGNFSFDISLFQSYQSKKVFLDFSEEDLPIEKFASYLDNTQLVCIYITELEPKKQELI
jgi:hypothetical protein